MNWEWVPMAGKGARYFVRAGDMTKLNRGFRTKREIDAWFATKNELGVLDWRVGSVFRIRGLNMDLHLVTRKGELA